MSKTTNGGSVQVFIGSGSTNTNPTIELRISQMDFDCTITMTMHDAKALVRSMQSEIADSEQGIKSYREAKHD